MILAAWMGLTVVRTGSVIASEETGSFQDAAEVVNFLNAATNATDLVLMLSPLDFPFKYLQLGSPGWIQGPGDFASDRLFIVLRDHHGPIPNREWQITTLNDIKQYYAARSEPKLAFSGPYTSVYIADGATVEHGIFCEWYCFHKGRVEP